MWESLRTVCILGPDFIFMGSSCSFFLVNISFNPALERVLLQIKDRGEDLETLAVGH